MNYFQITARCVALSKSPALIWMSCNSADFCRNMHYSRSCCDIKNRALYRYRFECVVYRIVEIECASSEICTCGVSKIDLKRRCCMRHMRSVTPHACPIPLTTLPKHPAGRWPSPGDARRTARHVVPSPPPPCREDRRLHLVSV